MIGSVIPIETIKQKIYLLRGQKVILDYDLGQFYQVPTGALIQAIKRNLERFPSDFMFPLSLQEVRILKSQTVISRSWGGRRRSPPYALTEAGVAMCASVLKSRRAALVNVQIIRSFIELREMLLSNQSLSQRVSELERTTDAQAKAIMSIIRELEKPPDTPKKHKLGF